jgi:antitoxin PrlF
MSTGQLSRDLLRKPLYNGNLLFSLKTIMSTLLVSSKGQIVLPAEMRRRLGMGAGARIEVLEEPDGLKLRVVRSVATADMAGMAGMVKAPARGVPRRLEDFDPASLLTRSRRGNS